MAAFQKIEQFVEDVAHAVHDLSADTVKVVLTNTAPDAANDAVLADITQIGAGNGYAAGGAAAATSSSGQTGGTYRLKLADVTFTAAGGAIGPFRYAVLYNATAAGGPLIGYFDYGSSITLNDGDSLTVDFDSTNGVLSLA